MADVGDINDMIYTVAIGNENSLQQVFKKIGSKITNVGKVIDSWTAGVDPHFPRR